MAAGMLPGLFTPKYNDIQQDARDEESRLQNVARMDPTQQLAYAGLSGARMAGQGLGNMIVSAAGGDPRSPAEKNVQAVEAAKQQVAQLGFNPDDPKSIDEFYKRVIQILQQQGLAAEALEVAKEWRTKQREDVTADLKLRDAQRKEKKDADTLAYQNERNNILRQRGIPEFQKYIDELERTTDPAQRQLLQDRLNQMLGKSGKGVKAVDYGDHVELVDAATGAPISSGEKGAAPLSAKDQVKKDDKDANAASAYKSAKAALQEQYNAAVDLYNHPGLEGITGRVGRLVGEPGAAGQAATTLAGADTRGALNLWQQVTGSTFLAALGQLKAASPTGSTGLGAVSDAEGKKVQAAAAALGREQDAPEFRQRLATYIQVLQGASQRLDEAAQSAHGLDPILLQQKPMTGSARGRGRPAATPAPAAPTPAPAAPAAPQGDRVRVKMPDGQTGTIPRANLAAAKAKGAVEVQ